MSGHDAATATATATVTVSTSASAAAPPEAGEQEVPRGIGASVPAADTRAKSEGTFPYAADLWAEGLLWAAVLRSPHAHARILSVDTSAAAAMPGVRAVVTHADVPGATTHGRRIADRPVFAHDVVRHHGEPIAAVAADHPDTARLAAAAIAVEYELLDAVTDPEQAFGAPALHPDGNLIRHIPLRYGDPEATGEVVVEGLYRIGRQDPAPIGAEAGLAVPRPDGGVEIYTASTDPHLDRDLAAACFGLEPDRVRVVVTGVPGATADREDAAFQLPLGLLALRTGHPVKLAATREESFLGHTHRHPTLLRYRHHADADGRLVKVEAQILMDAGAYADSSSESLAAAVAFACGPYVVPHAFVEGWAVRTNNPPSGHVRGEGAMQVCAAYEGQMDKLAAALGIDGAELRLRNVLATGDLLPTGQTVTCPAPVAELLRAVRDFELPSLPKDTPEDEWLLPGGPEGAGEPGAVRRGVGYGVGMVHMLGAEGTDEVSTATVKVVNGAATVICAAVDTGQGFSTLARQIVQETLGVDEVVTAPVDTDQPPHGPGCARPPHVGERRRGRAGGQNGPHPTPPADGPQARHVDGTPPDPGRPDHLVRRRVLYVGRGSHGGQGTLGHGPVPPPPDGAPGRRRPGRRLRGPGLLRDPRGGGRGHRAGLGTGGGAGGGSGRGPHPQPPSAGSPYRSGRHAGRGRGADGEPPLGLGPDPPPRPDGLCAADVAGRPGGPHRQTGRRAGRGGPVRGESGQRDPCGDDPGGGSLGGKVGHGPPGQQAPDPPLGGGRGAQLMTV